MDREWISEAKLGMSNEQWHQIEPESLGGRQARVKATSTDPNLDSNWKIQMLSDL